MERHDINCERGQCNDNGPMFTAETAYELAESMAQLAVELANDPVIAEDIALTAAAAVFATVVLATEAARVRVLAQSDAERRRFAIDLVEQLRSEFIDLDVLTQTDLAGVRPNHNKLSRTDVGYLIADRGLRIAAATLFRRLGHDALAKKLTKLARIKDSASANAAQKRLDQILADIRAKQCAEARCDPFWDLEDVAVDFQEYAVLAAELAADPDTADTSRARHRVVLLGTDGLRRLVTTARKTTRR